MYNPYDKELMRRRQQQEMSQPQFEQPAPMANPPLYSGPELPQWTPMGNSGQSMHDAGAGIASLLQRFKKPKGATAADAGAVWRAGGSL